jgi:hypothetical protein
LLHATTATSLLGMKYVRSLITTYLYNLKETTKHQHGQIFECNIQLAANVDLITKNLLTLGDHIFKTSSSSICFLNIMIMQEMVLIIPYNKHHQNQEHKKHASMLQKTDAAADRSKRDVIGDSVKEGKVQEMGTSWMPHWMAVALVLKTKLAT